MLVCGTDVCQYTFFRPIYCQSIQGVSGTESGVRFTTLVGPQIALLVVIGAVVSKVEVYVSYPRRALEVYHFSLIDRYPSLCLVLPLTVWASAS